MPNVIDILEQRGFIDAMTSQDLRSLADKPLKVYCGFDPTGDSLHLGNLVSIMGLAWFQRCGHTPVALVGGATGLIGDPSGKSQERPVLDEETIQRNLTGIEGDLRRVLDFTPGPNQELLVNNLDWYRDVSFIEFLRDIGRHFRVGPMLAKESVKTRLQSEEGMSYTEFSYQVLQGYDFYHLYTQLGVNVQIGGSDQWGNITAGTELVRKLSGNSVFGVTFPLLTRSDGKKFGKSEQGAIWLSPERLSPYQFYQYLYRMPDADVIRLLKMLTFLELEEIQEIERSMQAPDATPNMAQARLAEEVTRIVHGENGVQTALKVTEGVRPGSNTALDAEILEQLAADMPSCSLSRDALVEQKLVEIMVQAGLQPSKGAARRLIQSGGAYLNNARIDDPDYKVGSKDLIDNRLLLLAAGKKNKVLVRSES